jgi:hypothetical protein
MAVVGIAKEKANLREARRDNEEYYYKRVFLVAVNNIKDDAIIVSRAFGLPYLGIPYATEYTVNVLALCNSIQYNQIALLYWEVVCEYTSKASSDSNKDPTFEPSDYSWGGTNIRETVTGQSTWSERYPDQDPTNVVLLNSTGILNSAYEPFCPPAEIDRMIPTLTFTRNEPSFNHRIMLYYVNSVNSNNWFGWWPRTVKIASISGDMQLKLLTSTTMQKYWRVTYVFHFNRRTWDLFLLDIGSYYFKGGFAAVPKNKQPFMIKNAPALGLLKADGDRSTDFVQNFKRFRILDECNFNPLMIPMIT